VTVTEGTNRIVGNDPERIVSEVLGILDDGSQTGRVPELWDGQAAKRIVQTLCEGEFI
jgi:UDP-N-acetylglucosamine 2-epimerase (non-hydrolysing)